MESRASRMSFDTISLYEQGGTRRAGENGLWMRLEMTYVLRVVMACPIASQPGL